MLHPQAALLADVVEAPAAWLVRRLQPSGRKMTPPPPTAAPRSFHIVGGECNYLLRVGPAPARSLAFVPDPEWKSDYMMSWRQQDIDAVLNEAGALLQATAAHLRLPVQVPLCRGAEP